MIPAEKSRDSRSEAMAKKYPGRVSRRAFVAGTAAAIGAPALAQDINGSSTVEMENDISETTRRNISSFRALHWQPYFSNLNNGAVLVDTRSRALHFWSEDQSVYKLYPTSVPMTEDRERFPFLEFS